MKRLLAAALFSAASLTAPNLLAQPSSRPSKADRAKVKKKMKGFDKEFKKAERRVLDEDKRAKANARARDAKKVDKKALGEKMRDKVKAAQTDKMAKAKARAAAAGPMTPEQRKARRKQILETAKARKANREARKKELRERQRVRLGRVPGSAKAKVAQELRHHARRVARLERIAVLAAQAEDEKASDRAATLMERENRRHQAKLTRITGKAQTDEGVTAPATEAAKEEANP